MKRFHLILAGLLLAVTSAFANPDRALWISTSKTGESVLMLNKEYIKNHPDRFKVIRMKAKDIMAGQLLAINDGELLDTAPEEANELKKITKKIFNVVKAGSNERPFYQLIGGHNRIRRGLILNPSVKLRFRVLEDLTVFSMPEQAGILSIYGHFWSPENKSGEYKSLKILQTQASPWRTIGKIHWIEEAYAHLFNPQMAFPEIELGKQVYLHLKSQGFTDKDLQTTKQVIKAIKKDLKCDSYFIKP